MQLRAHRRYASGVTLVELMIAIAVLAIIVSIGFPSFTLWIQNARIRTATEAVMSGIKLARTEAIRRNTLVRFDLVNSITNSCALSSSGTSWVVARGTPVGACGTTPADPADTSAASGSDPKIIQKWTAAEGAQGATITATGGSTLIFNGIGRTSTGTTITKLAITHSSGATGLRKFDIEVESGGLIRMVEK